MAEGFARKYGSDVMEVQSAGLAPAATVAPLTQKIMQEKNVDVSEQFPKGLEAIAGMPLDLVINMSGQRMPVPKGVNAEDWKVQDPIGLSEDIYRQVANEIEQRVMRLVLTLRAQQTTPPKRPAFDAGKPSQR